MYSLEAPDSGGAKKAFQEQPHLNFGSFKKPGFYGGQLIPAESGLFRSRDLSITSDHWAFKTAPGGGVAVSRYFQSSIRSLRASATMPIRRKRLLPRAKRS